MAKIETPSDLREFPVALIRNMILLSTSGFGVVVALAWNEVIKNAVETYIAPYLGKDSGLISLFIYAVVVTTLAVLVTMQLSRIEKQISALIQRDEEKKEQAAAKKKSSKKS